MIDHSFHHHRDMTLWFQGLAGVPVLAPRGDTWDLRGQESTTHVCLAPRLEKPPTKLRLTLARHSCPHPSRTCRL